MIRGKPSDIIYWLFSKPCIAYKKLVHLYLQNQKPHKNDSLMGWSGGAFQAGAPNPMGLVMKIRWE
ncbi:hypothetical protein GBA52_022184 [Prunus armeniaca]|nr:hypothetical protein GBA52_022184 [Prunus armeniaca]